MNLGLGILGGFIDFRQNGALCGPFPCAAYIASDFNSIGIDSRGANGIYAHSQHHSNASLKDAC